ncbi:hypothetical protein AB1Y20_003161 [Prymnesium parvum]|uniref:UBC core domain-containing protein n=1 Tax=Prymnesium parvum TaxID=97485 RepID=A0AB34JB91_PRYPA
MLTLQEDLLSSLLAIGGAERAVTLLDIASDQDLLACLAEQSDAAIMGRLACCSKALRRYCMADALWKKFLRERWGIHAKIGHPVPGSAHREYAFRSVEERWAKPASTPRTVGGSRRRVIRPSPAGCAALRTPLGPGKENVSPAAFNKSSWRTPTTTRSGRRSSMSTLTRTSSQSTALAISRLQLGLKQLMSSGHQSVSAFPIDDEMDVWKATARCRPGGPYGGKTLEIRLQFELSKGLEETLPTVHVVDPRCFHPNVSEDGQLCPLALRKRCDPLDLIGQVLLHIVELIDRPCFSVAPLNLEAAVCWYGDSHELRERVSSAAAQL